MQKQWILMSILGLFIPGTSAHASCTNPALSDFATCPPQLIGSFVPGDCASGSGNPPCGSHKLYLPHADTTLKSPLVVMIPGSGHIPGQYDYLLANFASAGFRTLGLSYDSSVSADATCGDVDPALNCYEEYREEKLYGNISPLSFSPDVATNQAIIPRLYKALEGLDTLYPTGGFDSYYNPPPTGTPITSVDPLTLIEWDELIVVGFSQGGGHAAHLCGTLVECKGAVYIDTLGEKATFDSDSDGIPDTTEFANWLINRTSAINVTPIDQTHMIWHRRGALPGDPAPDDRFELYGFELDSPGGDVLMSDADATLSASSYQVLSTDQCPVDTINDGNPNTPCADRNHHGSMTTDAAMPTATSVAAGNGAGPVVLPDDLGDLHLSPAYRHILDQICAVAGCP